MSNALTPAVAMSPTLADSDTSPYKCPVMKVGGLSLTSEAIKMTVASAGLLPLGDEVTTSISVAYSDFVGIIA